MIHAYLSVWRSSGTVQAQQQQNVDSKLSKHLEEVVHPWPEISATPTPEHSDGRFAKAFPLTFPTGYVDLYQERIQNDFSVEDLAQHVFRHYDGRALRALGGHRVIWAIFNTVLRTAAQKKGAVLHKQSHATALTKQALLELYATRDDLVQKLSSYGADIPTTSVSWKRAGNQLELIVRQMSWAAPVDEHRPGSRETKCTFPHQAVETQAERNTIGHRTCCDADQSSTDAAPSTVSRKR